MRLNALIRRKIVGDKGKALHRTRPDGGMWAVISRLTGALMRALMVMIMIATPSVVTQSASIDTAEVVALVALFAAGLTFVEYAATYPGLVEFRDAPPFNRIRFLSLFATLFLLSVVCMNRENPAVLARLIEFMGAQVTNVLDFPYSPVRLVVEMLPPGTDAARMELFRVAAGLSYFVMLVTIVVFIVILRLAGWPSQDHSFNVWVNLPTFDPTTGGDVVERLHRDSLANVLMGFLLPFVIPVVIKAAADVFDPLSLASPHTLIWTMTIWGFLPVSLLMRGIAMGRIAAMIAARRKLHEQVPAGGTAVNAA